MKFLLIPDKFKGSLTSEEVARAVQLGIEKVQPRAAFHSIKASDGGDGFLNAIARYKPYIGIQTVGEDPLGRARLCSYLYNQEESAAYIELANASGLELLSVKERDPMITSTYGTGLQIKDAIEKGARNIYVGLGGSATNDGGIGIAAALGFVFLNDEGNVLKPIGKNLLHVRHIDTSCVSALLKEVSFFAVNDVTNPLFGEDGAAFVYAPQKGASAKVIVALDKGLQNLHRVVTHLFGSDNSVLSGAGAAGGAAYGLKSFLNAEFLHGIDFILKLSEIETTMASETFDYIITGEGRIDAQTLSGKLVQGVLSLGKKFDIPVIAVCGQLDVEMTTLKEMGIADVIEIQNANKPLSYNLKNAQDLLIKAMEKFYKSAT
ncbi:glycerate kinase [Maribacter chungangensis]|uniref:Glycerate kinase n=1 Tax=Maribacter chungangensis TaxID=1069117 RepID=A0ABW3B7X0_9FLAO